MRHAQQLLLRTRSGPRCVTSSFFSLESLSILSSPSSLTSSGSHSLETPTRRSGIDFSSGDPLSSPSSLTGRGEITPVPNGGVDASRIALGLQHESCPISLLLFPRSTRLSLSLILRHEPRDYPHEAVTETNHRPGREATPVRSAD